MNDWIDVTKELPPCNGTYETAGSGKYVINIHKYDGYGFYERFSLFFKCYVNVQYFREIKKIKRYGKIKNED